MPSQPVIILYLLSVFQETTDTAVAPQLGPFEPARPGQYKVVCYFTNWAWYRPGVGKYKPENIDPELCTHIIYGFAVLDGNNFKIKTHDSWADIDNEFYKKVTDLKAKGIKVLLAIGGWNDSLGSKYSQLVNDPARRTLFIAHVLEFIMKHNFDGLDLDWEYPKCWQVRGILFLFYGHIRNREVQAICYACKYHCLLLR